MVPPGTSRCRRILSLKHFPLPTVPSGWSAGDEGLGILTDRRRWILRCALGQGIGVFPRNHQERKERRLARPRRQIWACAAQCGQNRVSQKAEAVRAPQD